MGETGTQGDLTVLLRRWQAGDAGAYREVVALSYQRLLAMAAGIIARAGLSTEPAALVHDAYLRLQAIGDVEWKDREHFFAVAATLFRRILVDRSRGGSALKRGGSARRVPLSPDLSWVEQESGELLDLDRALDELERREPDLVRLVELRYFLGCTVPEIVALRGVSGATVERHLRFARTWLYDRLQSGLEAP
jgi:RNA polymerase sigma factor (TIGR02999 family)